MVISEHCIRLSCGIARAKIRKRHVADGGIQTTTNRASPLRIIRYAINKVQQEVARDDANAAIF
jgi:hypothetical protein